MNEKNRTIKMVVCVVFLVLAVGLTEAAGADVNVAGSWNVKVSGDAGNADQTINLKQDGNKITGTFKGPRQSGTIEGSIEGNNIKFSVHAMVPIDYVGTVDGDSMKGTLTGRGKTGDWTATRAK